MNDKQEDGFVLLSVVILVGVMMMVILSMSVSIGYYRKAQDQLFWNRRLWYLAQSGLVLYKHKIGESRYIKSVVPTGTSQKQWLYDACDGAHDLGVIELAGVKQLVMCVVIDDPHKKVFSVVEVQQYEFERVDEYRMSVVGSLD